MHIEDNKLIITTWPKRFYFDLLKNVENTVKHEIDSIIKHDLHTNWVIYSLNCLDRKAGAFLGDKVAVVRELLRYFPF